MEVFVMFTSTLQLNTFFIIFVSPSNVSHHIEIEAFTFELRVLNHGINQ